MESDRFVDRYQLLCRMLGAEGRRELLFGSSCERSLDAFRSCAVGRRMPLVYLELPLLGEPRLDLQVCLNRADVGDGCEPPAGAPPVLGPLLGWLRESDDCPGVDLAFDVSAGELRVPQVMALMREGALRDAEGFFAAAGDARAAVRFRAHTERIPSGWWPWYVGIACQRSGCPVRLDYHVSPKVQRNYRGGDRSFAEDLRVMGYEASMVELECCQRLLGLPFLPNLQLDVMDDGMLGPVLGYSLAMPHEGPARLREDLAQGALGQACLLMEEWGLADCRWRQLAGCCIGAAVDMPGAQGARTVAIRCVPTFLKVRMRPEGPLDAKAYLMCTMGDFCSDQKGTSCE